MPKKKQEFPQESEEKYEEVWDVGKIIAGGVILIVLIIAGIIGKRILFHESLAPSSFIPRISMPSVKGLSTFNAPEGGSSNNFVLPSSQTVQNQIQTIQQQVTHLNVAQLASSSPQVQDILKQIEQIPSGPEGQVKAACMRLCNNL